MNLAAGDFLSVMKPGSRTLFRRFRELSLAELFLLTRTTTVLVAVRLALWLIPFRNLRRMVALITQPRFARATRLSVNQLGWGVRAASRLVPRATCLTQAIALHILLRREGLESSVQLGVAKEGECLKAHAWVENQGEVVIGNHELERYSTILIWR